LCRTKTISILDVSIKNSLA